MSDPYTGEIRMFAGNYAPVNWALCNGGLMSVAQNPQLFALLGCVYGGDCRNTFGLPDLRGRVPMHQGRGPGLSNYRIGEMPGQKQVHLTSHNLPKHNHFLEVLTDTVDISQDPNDKILSNTKFNLYNNNPSSETMVNMWEDSIGPSGESNQSHHYNMQPYLCVSFIICLNGTWPSRPS